MRTIELRRALASWVTGALTCACVVLHATAAGAVDGRGDTSKADQCEIGVDLMAVVYDHRRPERSIAMVVHGGKAGRVVRVGSRVAGLPVLAVLPEALWLGTVESPCWIPLDHQGSQRASKPKSKPKPKRRSKPKKKSSKRKR